MSKYFETKKDSLEQAVLEAMSPVQPETIVEKIEYVEYKFKNSKDAKSAKSYFEGIQLMTFDVNDDNISNGELMVDAGNKDMTKYHKEVMQKFKPKVMTQEKKLTDEDKLDAVNPDAVKKKFKDRKDKDIDNDGDVDSSDKFLHKRRKAISKAVKEQSETLIQRAANEITKMWEKSANVKSEEEMDDEDDEEPKNGKKTMTGKPMSKVETAPKDKIEK
tara:strand:+ start:3930 stop:4583 length:654 start_codon:yes stop_codon:yes gene_type:complete